MSAMQERHGVAVVLAGAGARGAYEAGVLSVLLPAIEAEGRPPRVFIGTSAGAINAVAFASLIHLGAEAGSSAVLDLWRQVAFGSVLRLRPGRGGLLDTTPLAATLDRLVDWEQLHDNVRSGLVSAVGVVATSCSTSGSTVFLELPPATEVPKPDLRRGIDYVATALETSHVRASSAIPVVFPAVRVERPEAIADWYSDGGVRLNTPIKPALAMHPDRVVVVATAPAEPPVRADPEHRQPPPGVAGGAAQLLYAMLADRMVEDLRTLARRNTEASSETADGHRASDVIPWLFAGPSRDDAGGLGRLVADVLGGTVPAPRRRRAPVVQLARRSIGRLLSADPSRTEVLSYLFFDPDFIDGSIRLGQRDARASLDPSGRPAWR
jgi:NTE family protein